MTQDEALKELKIEAEKLVSLLKENETGLMTWWGMLADRLQKINTIKRYFGM